MAGGTSRRRFGPFEFDLDTHELRRDGRPVRLPPQPARVLALLLERPGDLVTRDDLRQRVWGQDTFVDFERGLNFCIAQVRAALGDTAASPTYVETVPKRGYRLIAPVAGTPPAPVPPPPAAAPVATQATSHRAWPASGLAIVALLILVVGVLVGALATSSATLRQGPRVGVVGFDNETDDVRLDRVARDVTNLVVVHLATAPGVAVIGNAAPLARSRARRDLAVVARELDLDFVVIGQVQRVDGRLRILAHLLGGRDLVHHWARPYDGSPDAPPALDATARAIASAVADRLAPDARPK